MRLNRIVTRSLVAIKMPLNCWQLLEFYRERNQSAEQCVEPELHLQWKQSEQQQ